MAQKYSDGKSVKVLAQAAVEANTFAVVRGFHGFACDSASSGEAVVLEIEQAEYRVTVPGGVTANVGDTLYIIAATGVITNTSSGNRAFLKVTEAKDSANRVSGILLPQS